MDNSLRLFVEQSLFSIAMFDTEMRYIAVSKPWTEMYPTTEEITGRVHYDLFPDLPNHWKEAHAAGLRGETVIKKEEFSEFPIGNPRWIRWHVLPWYRSENDLGGILLTTEDVTQRKEEEWDRKHVLSRFELIQQAAHLGMWDWDIPNKDITLNAEYYEVLGIPVGSQVTYQDFSTLVHPEDLPRVSGGMSKALNGEDDYEEEFRIIRRSDGKIRWVKDKGRVEFDDSGNPIRAYGAIIDVTRVTLLEHQQLKSIGEDYHQFINAALESIWVVDRNGVTTFVNSAVSQLLGYTEDELVGKSMFSFTDAEWNSVSFKKFSDRKNGQSERYKMQLRKKDGSGVWCLISANPIFDHDEFLGTVTVITDFSEYQEALSAKDKRIEELEAMLSSRS